jgi:predicted dienelactone hydrolase
MLADKIIGPHIDATRVGLAGFSAGGFTALVGAGARADPARFEQFCAAHPDDGVCKPQIEFAITPAQRTALGGDPALADVMRQAGEDYSIPHVRAVFAMAPAIVQGLTPSSLRRLAVPVSIVLGEADDVAPPTTNGETAARLIPHARLQVVPGAGHYDFLADCAPDAQLPICALARHQKEAHQLAIEAAIRLFRDAL